jgi:mitochondrial fission protein ELM1
MKNEQPESPAPILWAISDGAAGNAVQAQALAQAAARRLGGEAVEKTVTLRRPFDRLPAALWALKRPRAGGWPFSGLVDGGAALAPPWPAIAIGCGRRSAPLVAALRRLGGVKAVQILAPGMAAGAFDLIVAPRHDALSGPNVVETLGGLNALDPAALAESAERWRGRLGHLPAPRVAVLVGGPSRSADFGAQGLQTLCDGLARLAVDGAGLMVTPSRRTPRGAVDKLADTLSGVGGWVWSRVGDNPYPGILGLADAIVVTADSVNMASEAAATGKPVLVARLDRLGAKIERFHAALEEYGAARPFRGELETWTYPPLREADRVAGRVAALLEGDGAPPWSLAPETLPERPD